MAGQQEAKSGKLTIAIEGCCHGDLDNIYGTLQHLERVEGKKIDLLICCGDFQAVRNYDDLETMACPPKYRALNTFYKYYSGEAKAPFPTLFIGGNHEAANYLWELYYGGWAAPNIYFLGFNGCVKFGGLRIAGLSGIFKQGDYTRGHDERLPYTDGSMRSIYHIRDFEVYRLMQIKQPLDIFLTHDWPRNIANFGNKASLLSKKPFLRSEVEDGSLGSPPAEQLLHTLQPSYWFSAHLHTKFAALVQHPGGNTTRFLSLDKCIPGRDFLQILELDAAGPPVFEYDEEWLAIMRGTHDLMNLNPRGRPLPGMGALRRGADPADVSAVREALAARGGEEVPQNFAPTAPAYHDPAGAGGGPGFKTPKPRGRMPTQHVRNPQTEALLGMLGLPYNLDHGQAGATPNGQRGSGFGQGFGSGSAGAGPRTLQGFPIAPPSVSAGAGQGPLPPPPPRPVTDEQVAAAMANPEEIDLGDDLDEDDPDAREAGADGPAGPAAGSDLGPSKELLEDPMFKPL